MNRPDEPTSIQPLPEPGDDDVARTLSEVLSSEAARIEPTDRLRGIREQAARRRLPWVPVAAAAAAAVLVGGVVFAVADHDRHPTSPPAAGSTTPPHPTPSGTPRPSPTPSSTAGTWAAPVYYLGSQVPGLFREFHALPVTPGPVISHVADALRVAMDPASPAHVGDVSPWLSGTSRAAAVSLSGGTVLVTLPDTETAAQGRSAEQARLAAQQLVWTASAVAQDARLRLRISFTSGPGRLFGALATTTSFSRPPAGRSYQDLAAIWVLKPEAGTTVVSPVVVSGQACTFEANVAWQLLSHRAVVRSGHTTATSGCPVRGTWSVPLKGLLPGDYTFRAYELDAKQGTSYVGLDTTTFTVH